MAVKNKLLAEFDHLVDQVESSRAVWRLGDWLVENVPNSGRGKPSSGTLSFSELATRSGLSVRWLQRIRSVAEQTSPERLEGVSVRTYESALAGRTLEQANALLKKRGHRLRDVTGPMESLDAIYENLSARSAKEQAEVVQSLIANPITGSDLTLELAGTDEAQTISVTHGVAEAVKHQKAEKEAADRGEVPNPDTYARFQFYQTIGSRAFNIYVNVQRIVQAIAQFDGAHDEEELEKAEQRLEAAEHMIAQAREALREAAAIDMDGLMADIQTHINNK